MKGAGFYVEFMKFAASLMSLIICLSFFLLTRESSGQGLQVDVEEFKRLAGEVADLKESNQSLQRKVRELQSHIDTLRTALRESNEKSATRLGDFATREDLKKIVDSIREVDEKREGDKKLILEQIKELGKTLTTPVETPSTKRGSKNSKERDHKETKGKESGEIEGEFFPYKVQKNESLGGILNAYNSSLKEKGRRSVTLDEVKRANPKININRIYEGQEILLPVPEKK